MLSNPPSPPLKSFTGNIPLLVALLITSVIHILLVLNVKIGFEQVKSKYRTITIDIIKPTAPPTKPKKVIAPVPAVTPTPSPVSKPQVITPKPASTKNTKPKKHRKAKAAALVPTFPAIEPIIAPTTPISEPVIEKTEPVTKTEPTPVAPIETIPTNPAISEPIIETTTSVDSAPLEAPAIDKPVEAPRKGTTKSGKKAKKKRKQSESSDNTQPSPLSLADLSAQIAQIGEKYANPTENSASRVKSLKSIRAHKVSARQYISDWLRKVERIGNLNYPEVAKEKDFSARLTMEVGIRADGSIDHIAITKSSGVPALDEAAKAIVRMGEPYSALSKDLTEEVDVLVIQRSWQFSEESGMTTR
jgi:TonB family protein